MLLGFWSGTKEDAILQLLCVDKGTLVGALVATLLLLLFCKIESRFSKQISSMELSEPVPVMVAVLSSPQKLLPKDEVNKSETLLHKTHLHLQDSTSTSTLYSVYSILYSSTLYWTGTVVYCMVGLRTLGFYIEKELRNQEIITLAR
jgi:integral membrane sensor domain MASE1